MRRVLRVGAGIVAALWPAVLCAQAWTPWGGDEPAQLTVRLVDRVGVPRAGYEEAQRVASAIFRQAGIELKWLTCGAGETQEFCTARVPPAEISVYLVRRSDFPPEAFAAGASGAAWQTAREGGRGLIYIFVDRAERATARHRPQRGAVMGHLVAHELGHLLIPTQSHARRGIMRAQLGGDEWQLARRQLLLFSSEEARRMRQLVVRQRRTHLAAAIPAAN